MKKTVLFAFLIGAASMPMAYSTTVTWGGVPTARTVVDATNINTIITSPSLVLAGTFANESFSLTSGDSLATNFASITSSGGWQQFALGQPQTATPLGLNGTGKIGGSLTDNTVTAAAFNGTPIYLMVFNASTVGSATQMGIFRANPAWNFPTNAGGVGDTSTFSTTSGGTPTMVAIGNFGVANSSTLQLTNNFNVAAVPEPSTFTAGAMLMLAAMGFRRRRRG